VANPSFVGRRFVLKDAHPDRAVWPSAPDHSGCRTEGTARMAPSRLTLVGFVVVMLGVAMLSGCQQLDSGLRMPGGAPPQTEPPLTDSHGG